MSANKSSDEHGWSNLGALNAGRRQTAELNKKQLAKWQSRGSTTLQQLIMKKLTCSDIWSKWSANVSTSHKPGDADGIPVVKRATRACESPTAQVFSESEASGELLPHMHAKRREATSAKMPP
jgi:hypothetical protein